MDFTHTVREAARRIKRQIMPGHAGLPMPVSYRFSDSDARRVAAVVRSGNIHHEQGRETAMFEHEFARFLGVRYAITTNSGTSALMLAVAALGLRSGDEVIVPAYTFAAVPQAVLANRALPVFADIDATATISPASIERLITPRTRAIIAVHSFGNVADVHRIISIARAHRLAVIEDCAQAVGAFYRGKPVGTFGDVSCFSFNVKKALPTGQGGMVVTDSDRHNRYIRSARNTGQSLDDGSDIVSFGGTMFMTEMEAVLGRSVLRQLPYLNGIRRRNAEYLRVLLAPIGQFSLYAVLPGAEPSYSRLSFLLRGKAARNRDRIMKMLREEGLPVKRFYPTPLYKYSLFSERKDLLTGNPFPRAGSVRYDKQPNAELFELGHIGMEFSPYWDANDMRFIATAVARVTARVRT